MIKSLADQVNHFIVTISNRLLFDSYGKAT